MNKRLYLGVREQTRQMSVKVDLTFNWQVLKNFCYQTFFFSSSAWTVLNTLLPKTQHGNEEGCQVTAQFNPPCIGWLKGIYADLNKPIRTSNDIN